MNLSEAIELANQGRLSEIPEDAKLGLAQEAFRLKYQIMQQDQLLYYQPASPQARKVHYSTAKEVVSVGGNRSSKTDTNLADLVICMTGIIPHSLPNYPKEKIHCPGRYRLVCESLTNTWAPVIRPKLQWDKWNGKDPLGGPNGHWGWIPPRFLIKGRWDESWLEKERTLKLTCGCTCQIMSYDQEVQDFSGSSLHGVLHDEGPPKNIYRENKMRTIDTAGWIRIAFTPPDDETTAWKAAWIYEEIYEKGLPGPDKDPQIDTFELWTEQNRILDHKDIEEVFKDLTPAQRETRGKGAFMHLGGRIYPTYTDTARTWCFVCNSPAFVKDGRCISCQNGQIVDFKHFVEPFAHAYTYPCVFLIDPHPRKPNMMIWVAVDPSDDWWQIGEMEVDGEPVAVRDRVYDFERIFRLNVAARLMDPNMGESPAHNAGARHISVRSEFDAVGLRCALADDTFDVGSKRIKEFLRPDRRTRQPRMHVFNTCPKTNKQFKSYVWDEHGNAQTTARKDPKQTPIAKNDDYPGLWKYFANGNFTYAGLKQGTMPIRGTRKARKAAYG